MNVVDIAVAKSYTNLVAVGLTNVSVSGTTISFTIASTGEIVTMTFPQPDDGISITNVKIDIDNHLICTLSDGTTVDAGELPVANIPIASTTTLGGIKPDGTTITVDSNGVASSIGGTSAVSSVNGQTGVVILDASDVGALPSDTTIPTKTSDLTNDSNFIDKDVNNLTNYYTKTETDTELNDKVNVVEGKGLSTNDFTNTLLTKLNGVEDSAEVNKIETVTVNGSSVEPTNKNISLTIPSEYTLPISTVDILGGIKPDGITTFVNEQGVLSSSGGGSGSVVSVNGQTGTVILDAEDVGALPNSTIIPTKTSDLTNDSNFITDANYVHTDNNFDDIYKAKLDASTANYTSEEETKLSGIQDGAEVNVNADWNSTSGDSLILNKPTQLSNFTNDLNFIDNSVNNLTNYYLKTQTYTQTEVNNLISNIITFNVLVVASLPTTDISTHTIYLVPKSTTTEEDIYDEYINIDGTTSGWEHIGSTAIDLSNYYTITQVDALLLNKVDKVDGKGLSTNDFTSVLKTKLDGVESEANNYSLPTATTSVLGGVKSGTDITIDTSGNVSVNDDSHNHIISNIDGLQTSLDSKYSASNPQPSVTGSSGSCTGNSATTTKLQTARTINGVSFNGTSNITIGINWIDL